MKFKNILLITGICISSIINAQSNFERSYLQQGLKQAGISIAELNGKFYVTSISDDCGMCISAECLTQIGQNGNVIQTDVFSFGTDDEMVGVLTHFGSGFIFPIVYDHFSATSNRKQIAIKYVDANGVDIWTTLISDSLNDLQNLKLVVDANNVITGFADNLTSGGVLFFRIDSSGNVIQKQSFGQLPEVYSVTDFIIRNNNFYVIGTGNVGGVNKTFFRKVDSNGITHDSTFYDFATEISGLRINSYQDGFLICGEIYDSLGFGQAGLMHIDSLGNILWNKTLTTLGQNIITSFAVFNNSRIVITGKSIDASNNVILFIISADSTGNLIWKRDYCLPGSPNGCLNSVGNSIIEASDHSIVVCGQVQYFQTYPNLYVLKADAEGLVNFVSNIVNTESAPFIRKRRGSELLTVENMSGNFSVSIFDMSGRLVLIKFNEIEFDFKSTEGNYVYKIEGSKGIYTGQLH